MAQYGIQLRQMVNVIRSFIAVPLPPQIHKNLAIFTRQYGLNSRENGFRPVKPENIHLTLKFLGEIEEHMLPKVSNVLSILTENLSPFTGSVRAIGAFPGWDKNPRVIWVGIEPEELFRDIYRVVDETTTKLGIPSDGKRFTPHLTLARISFQSHESDLVFNKLKGLSPEPEFGEFTVDRVHFIKSVLLPQGPAYTLLSSHPFSA